MAQINGYRSIPHSSYNEWRQATLGNGYNVDGYAGNQCWDYCAQLWFQYDLRLITKPSGYGSAADCWLVSKNVNAKAPFIAVNGKTNIKRGDVIVTNRYSNSTSRSTTGHICFADEDYNPNTPNEIWTVGQIPSKHGQNGDVSRDKFSLVHFLGIFRNTMWTDTPEPPTPTPPPYVPPLGNTDYKRDRFPWAIAVNHWDY